MMDTYTLDRNGKPRRCGSLEFSKLVGSDERIVAKTTVAKGIDVSTVFIGIDMNYGGKGPPILWETMVFGGELDGYQDRYTSEVKARDGHDFAVFMVRQKLGIEHQTEEKIEAPTVGRKFKLEE